MGGRSLRVSRFEGSSFLFFVLILMLLLFFSWVCRALEGVIRVMADVFR